MHEDSILMPRPMGTIETESCDLGSIETQGSHSLRKALFAAILAFGVAIGGAALADIYTMEERPLEAIPSYSEAITAEGYTWEKLYQAVLDENLSHKEKLWQFLHLRLSDLGYESPKDATGEIRTQIMSDLIDWEILVFKYRRDEITDNFLDNLSVPKD